MSFLNLMTCPILAVIIGTGLVISTKLAALPGKVADRREHPQTDAIRVTGWLGLPTLGPLWLVALIWAYTQPGDAGQAVRRLSQRIETLEEELRAARGGRRPSVVISFLTLCYGAISPHSWLVFPLSQPMQ